jgi:hypothetical protein
MATEYSITVRANLDVLSQCELRMTNGQFPMGCESEGRLVNGSTAFPRRPSDLYELEVAKTLRMGFRERGYIETFIANEQSHVSVLLIWSSVTIVAIHCHVCYPGPPSHTDHKRWQIRVLHGFESGWNLGLASFLQIIQSDQSGAFSPLEIHCWALDLVYWPLTTECALFTNAAYR